MFELERRYRIILALFLGIMLFAGGIFYARHFLYPQPPLTVNSLPSSPEETGQIKVHLAGAVENPGVYELPAGSRMQTAIEKAVPSEQADIHSLNLASVLIDGQKVYVPRLGETADPTAVSDKASPGAGPKLPQGKVNLNTASLAQLDSLPGIGPALAQRIVNYRQEKGGFRRIEEVKNVSGIGDKLYSQIKDLITAE